MVMMAAAMVRVRFVKCHRGVGRKQKHLDGWMGGNVMVGRTERNYVSRTEPKRQTTKSLGEFPPPLRILVLTPAPIEENISLY